MLKYFSHALVALNIIASLSCVIIAAKFVVVPWVIEATMSAEYKDKMSSCDFAMRTHLIAKNRVTFEKSLSSLEKLEAAEVGLIQCHDYDMLRKKMISWGLSQNDLARIGLEAIEEKAVDIENLVEIHEFKY